VTRGAGAEWRVPFRRAAWRHVGALVFLLAAAFIAIVPGDPLERAWAGFGFVASALAWGFFLRCAGPPKLLGQLTGAPLPLTVEAPRRPAAVLLAAWLLSLAVVALSIVIAHRGPEPADRRWPFLVLILVLAVPVLLRLLAGRYHLWRLDLDDRGIRYRGGKRDRFLPWSDIIDVRHDERGHRLRVVGRSQKESLDVPLLVFDHPPLELIDTVERAWVAGRGSR
jgi:hypothetical protein